MVSKFRGALAALALVVSACSSGSSSTPQLDAGGTTYGAASFSGPWIMEVSGAPNTQAMYLMPDGLGTVADMGAFNLPNPIGNYTVQSKGDLHVFFAGHGTDPSMEFVGALSSTSYATGTIAAWPTTLTKVADPGACAGSWTGSLTQIRPSSATYPITLTVDASGTITAGTISGKATSMAGRRFYCEGGKAVGFATSNASDGYAQVQLAGALSGNTVSGTFAADGAPLDGTFTLTR